MKGMKIRKATKKDAAIFAEYRYRMFRDMEPQRDFSRIRGRFIRESREYYSKHLGGRGGYDCVVLIDRKIIACGSVIFEERPPHIKRLRNTLGYVLSIYVEEDFRRRGIAKAIMARLHEEAGKRGVRKLSLHASAAGRRVYESMGYRENGSYLEVQL